MGGREVGSTVIWQATALAVVAAGVGVPLGIVAGRWGWRVLAVQLGVASGPVVPLLVVTAVAAAVIVVADVIAVIPARRAARVAPAQALRVE
jgi:putative ABC transport system permease protein